MTSKVYLVKFMLNNAILTILVKEGCSVARLWADQEVFNYMKINCTKEVKKEARGGK